MDFVINNYIIFMVVGVLLFMALIGYIADHKNFEKKPKKQKKGKKEKQENKVESVLETPSVEEPVMVEETPEVKEEVVEAVPAVEEPIITEGSTEESVPVTEMPTEDTPTVQEMPVEESVKPMDEFMNVFETPAELTTEPVQEVPVETSSMEGQMEETPVFETIPVEPISQPETPVVDNKTEINEPIVNAEGTNTQEQNSAVEDIWKF